MTTATLERTWRVGAAHRRMWSLAWTLAVTEWRLRFYGSVLGYAWSLARPFALFGVIYLVFVKFAKLGASVDHYAVYILFALVMFQFFGELVAASVQSLVTRENLIRKVPFPRFAIPLSIGLTALFNLGMTLVAVVIFAVASGVEPGWGWLELLLLVGVLLAFGLGLGMLLSVLFVHFRDVQPIWDVVAQGLFYASPVLYVASAVPDRWRDLYLANPVAAVLSQMRHAVVDPAAPSLAALFGTTAWLALPLAIALAALAVGWSVFAREAPRIAESL